MKDEYQVRVEALNLTFKMAGLSNEARTREAYKLEQYILNGYSGQAPAAPQAPPEAPVTEGKAPSQRRTRRGSEAPAKSGEASDKRRGEIDQSDEGRPSTRVSGALVQ